MNKIDISSWGEFKVSDLFDIHPTKHYNDTNGKALANSKLFDADGKNPVVVNSAFNNGIGGYSNKDCNEKGGIITFSDTTTTDAIFYQENDFIGYSHIQGMYPKKYQDNWSKYSMKFFEVSFHSRANTLGYNYVNKFTRDLANNMSIKLPIDNNGEPDWNYMESYMKHIEKLSQDKLSSLIGILQGGGRRRLEIKQWEEFKIGDLFEIKKPQVYHTRQVVENEQGIPYIVRSKYNNGMKYYANIKNDEPCKEINPAKVISFGSENASFFYQEKEWISGRDMYYIDTSMYSNYICFFLISCLETLTSKYSYSFGLFPDLLKQEKIKLPVNLNGEPDWQFMNDYMKNMETIVEFILNIINKSKTSINVNS